MKRKRTVQLVFCALFVALSAILTQIAIPIGPVPITLTHVAIFMAGGLLGGKLGMASMVAYVLLGSLGAPIFSGFGGGVGKLLGPTGGFFVGYILCALVVGALASRFGRKIAVLIPAMYVGWIVTYIPGLLWYMFSLHATFEEAFSTCVLYFLPGDVAKTVLSVVLINRLYPVLQRMGGLGEAAKPSAS